VEILTRVRRTMWGQPPPAVRSSVARLPCRIGDSAALQRRHLERNPSSSGAEGCVCSPHATLVRRALSGSISACGLFCRRCFPMGRLRLCWRIRFPACQCIRPDRVFACLRVRAHVRDCIRSGRSFPRPLQHFVGDCGRIDWRILPRYFLPSPCLGADGTERSHCSFARCSHPHHG